LLAIVQEIQPVRGEKVRSTKMPPNGSRSRLDRRAKVAKVKAKAKERKVATAAFSEVVGDQT
jgi:hypothetical protein